MATKFEHPGHHVDIVRRGRRVGTMSVGGPILKITLDSGRVVHFEIHNYFGPMPLNQRTGCELSRCPAGFWDAILRWQEGGRLVDGDVCLVPAWCEKCDGRGTVRDERSKLMRLCKECSGTRIRDAKRKGSSYGT